MTIATMGRRMKKFAMAYFPRCLSLALGGRRVWSKRSFFFRLYSLGD